MNTTNLTTDKERTLFGVVVKQRAVINRLYLDIKHLEQCVLDEREMRNHYCDKDRERADLTLRSMHENMYLCGENARLQDENAKLKEQLAALQAPGKATSAVPSFLQYLDEKTLMEAFYDLFRITHPTGWSATLNEVMYALVQGNDEWTQEFKNMYFEVKTLKDCFEELAKVQHLAKIQHLERQISERRSANDTRKTQVGGGNE